MSLDRGQFRNLIERVLRRVDPALCSLAAVNLLLGTAAQESRFGTYLRQLRRGPARGVFQMEPGTFRWLRGRYKKKYPLIADRLFAEIEWDLRLSIIMARLRYRIVPVVLPDADDVVALARYWKQFFNTIHGAGTVEEFVGNYKKYVE